MCREFGVWRYVLVAAMAALLAGCGSEEYVVVTGRVTLDGEPLENAFVTFLPDASGQGTIAYGKTDADGTYELLISDDHTGILPGRYRAEISTADIAFDPVTNAEIAVRERVPAQYNKRTTLTDLVVELGESHEFDFQLESSGRGAQSPPER